MNNNQNKLNNRQYSSSNSQSMTRSDSTEHMLEDNLNEREEGEVSMNLNDSDNEDGSAMEYESENQDEESGEENEDKSENEEDENDLEEEEEEYDSEEDSDYVPVSRGGSNGSSVTCQFLTNVMMVGVGILVAAIYVKECYQMESIINMFK
jgi:hypothetical protein